MVKIPLIHNPLKGQKSAQNQVLRQKKKKGVAVMEKMEKGIQSLTEAMKQTIESQRP
jgi:hypothetical protein